MKVPELVKILEAEILCGEGYEQTEITSACGADLMSDVMAFVKDQAVLLTGLTNVQVIRTAEIMDIVVVVVVRGKVPSREAVKLACERGIVLVSSPLSMFNACGRLYAAGLPGGTIRTFEAG